MLNDHAHPIEGCNHVLSKLNHQDDGHDEFARAECALKGVAHRVAEYHSIDTSKVMSVFNMFGKNMAEVFAGMASILNNENEEASAAASAGRNGPTKHDHRARTAAAKRRLVEERLHGYTNEVFGRKLQDDEEEDMTVVISSNEPSESEPSRTRAEVALERIQSIKDTIHSGSSFTEQITNLGERLSRWSTDRSLPD